jgi:hypothetical protein
VLCCVALLGAAHAGMNLDWWSLPRLREEIRRGEEKDAALARTLAEARGREAAKRRATRELLAGRLTLTQAAACFRDVDAASGLPSTVLQGYARGTTEEERWCRQVIAWAEIEAEAAGSAGNRRPTRDRLEAELRRLLAAGGGKVALAD